MRTVNRSLLSATLSLSAVVASVFAFAPSAHAQAVPTVITDPTLTPSGVTTNPGGTYFTGALQYHANGATFPGLVLRVLTDFYGLHTPNTDVDLGRFPNPTFPNAQAPGTPRNNSVQYNYCGTGSGNGRATFTGTAQALFGNPANIPCGFVASTGASVLASPISFTPAPSNHPFLPCPAPAGANYACTNYPTFPTGLAAAGSAAPLFAFSDSPANLTTLSSGDLTNYTNNKLPTRGRANQVPVFFAGITPVFNPAVTATPPRISTLDLCKLFDGTITSYSQLTAPLTPLSGPVSLIVRSDSSGTTTAFTAYLAAQCVPLYASLSLNSPGGFTGYYLTNTNGVNLFPTLAPNPSTSFARAQGNDGVAALVLATAGGVGYTEAGFSALTTPFTGPTAASLQNPVTPTSFLTASVLNVRNATTNVSFTPNSPANPCVLTVTGLGTPTGYPIVAQSYALTYQNYPTPEETNATRGLFSFILGNAVANPVAQNDNLSQGLNFVLLRRGPGNSTAIPAINRLRTVARGCINNTANVPTGFSPLNGGGLGGSVTITGINFTATTVGFTTGFNGVSPVFTTVPATLNANGTLTATPPAGTITGPIRVGTIQTPNDYTP
jgi:phosphate transport system substrate-binding protein